MAEQSQSQKSKPVLGWDLAFGVPVAVALDFN
jgi:hypothetical protein